MGDVGDTLAVAQLHHDRTSAAQRCKPPGALRLQLRVTRIIPPWCKPLRRAEIGAADVLVVLWPRAAAHVQTMIGARYGTTHLLRKNVLRYVHGYAPLGRPLPTWRVEHEPPANGEPGVWAEVAEASA